MRSASLATLVLVIGCRPASPASSAPPAEPQVEDPSIAATPQCLTPTDFAGVDADIDGDGEPDRIVLGGYEITIYLRRADCLAELTVVDVRGSLAFVHVVPRSGEGIRDLSIDTWLMHGDRRRSHWVWSGSSYVKRGHTEIPGPRPPAHD